LKNIDKKINSLKERIEFKRNLLNLIDSKETKLIEITKAEILSLERKMKILEERKKTGVYVPKKPELGDDRYKSFEYKQAIDMLRVLYYEFFHKDPSLSPIISSCAMFDDPTLPIYSSNYLIRGEIPFSLMLTFEYPEYEANDKCSIGIKFDKKFLSKEISDEYLKLMSALIKEYSDNEINFICCDGINMEDCTLSYIGDDDFFYYEAPDRKTKMYYDFFDRLCDNNWRNIVYVADSMKKNALECEINQVDTEIIIPHMKRISKDLGITLDELKKSNEELCNKVFIKK